MEQRFKDKDVNALTFLTPDCRIGACISSPSALAFSSVRLQWLSHFNMRGMGMPDEERLAAEDR